MQLRLALNAMEMRRSLWCDAFTDLSGTTYLSLVQVYRVDDDSSEIENRRSVGVLVGSMSGDYGHQIVGDENEIMQSDICTRAASGDSYSTSGNKR